MKCEFDVKSQKENSVLVMKKDGIVECEDKAEFEKDVYASLSEAENTIEMQNQKIKEFEEKLKKQDEKINKFCKAIYDFINIMKGENTNEKNN